MLKRSLFGLLGLLLTCSVNVSAESTSKVLVLGDSLSAAYGLPPEQGWVAALSRRFANSQIELVNASISGATTAAGLERLPMLLKQHQPDWVALQLGANDGLQGKPIGYIQNNLETLITQAQSANSRVILLGIRLPPNLGRRYTEPFFDMYATLAKEYELNYIPFILDGVAGNEQLMQDDGLHPNQEGQKVMADQLGKRFSEFFGIQPSS